jgi:rhamnose transport system ATP-binding protein
VGGQLTAHLETRAVSKRFGGTLALDGVSVSIERGTVHALVGENGAGKTTLGRVLAGAVRPDGGTVALRGEEIAIRTPREAHAHGIAMIAQELAIAPDVSVLDNVFLGVEAEASGGRFKRAALRRRYDELCASAGFALDPDARAGSLRLADQQKVEILRVLARRADVVIMDEPTAALSPDEAERLFAVIRALRDAGTTVIYVSHFLDEVLALAQRVSVLKDGKLVRTAETAGETADSLIESMLGRTLDRTFPAKRLPADDAPVVLEARGLARAGVLAPVDLSVRAGEIVCIAGLVGSGRSELVRAIFGSDPATGGELRVRGTAVRTGSPPASIAAGMAMLPESRKDQGLLLGRSVLENLGLARVAAGSRWGVIDRKGERRRADELVAALDVRAGGLDRPVGTLSGGNQQKVLFGRWLFDRPAVLIADEPTRGVDVGAKRAIYDLVTKLAADGVAVLLVSSELEEVVGLAHRILVMRGGAVVSVLPHDAEAAQVMTAAFGADGDERLEAA